MIIAKLKAHFKAEAEAKLEAKSPVYPLSGCPPTKTIRMMQY